ASATVGVTSLWLAGVLSGSGLWSALSLWWAGDYLGALVVAPVVLTSASPAGSPIGRSTALGLALMVGGAVVAMMGVVGGRSPAALIMPAHSAFLLFRLVIAAALRFG